ncbi:MAG: ATP-binding protein [Polyangiales bacterium]
MAPEESLEQVQKALDLVADLETPASRRVRGDALVQRARGLFFTRSLAAAGDAANAAATLFDELGDVDGLVRARAAQGSVFSALGHDDAAIELLEDGRRLAELPGVSLEARVKVLAQRASALRDCGRTDDALEAFEQTLPLAEELGRPVTIATLLLNHAATATRAGNHEIAERTLDKTRALVVQHCLGGLRGWLSALEGAVALAEGDFERARARAAEGIDAGGDGDARVNAIRTWAQAVSRHPSASGQERDRARARLVELVEEARKRQWLGDLPAICRDLADLSERVGDLAGSIRWHKEAVVAREVAERSRRQQHLEAERLRIELARVAVEAEQLRVRSEMLAEANKRLAILGEERARLLAMVAHDLRSPLTAIGFCVEQQRRDLVRGRATGEGETLETIAFATARMTELIDAALSTDSIRRGSVLPRAHALDAVDLVSRCVQGLAPLAQRKSIRVEVIAPEPITFLTDAPALSRIVENLLTNALKFTPRGKEVRTTLRRERPFVVLEIADQGPGFLPGEIGALFELGKTGNARPTAGEVSSGIGLSVVRELVFALGGEVTLGNRNEGGAMVTVRLPERASASS